MSDAGGGAADRGDGRRRRRRRRGQRPAAGPRPPSNRPTAAVAADTEADDRQPSTADEPRGVLLTTEHGKAHSDGPAARCPICGLVIRNLYSAITERESQEPAHFDCVLRQLEDMEELGAAERLAYLGAGSFGVIQLRARQSTRGRGRVASAQRGALFIRKRIEYEESDPVPEWRQGLALPGAGTIYVQMASAEAVAEGDVDPPDAGLDDVLEYPAVDQ